MSEKRNEAVMENHNSRGLYSYLSSHDNSFPPCGSAPRRISIYQVHEATLFPIKYALAKVLDAFTNQSSIHNPPSKKVQFDAGDSTPN